MSYPSRWNPIPPVSNITPFTYRDGVTYLELLESIRRYVNGELIDQIKAKIEEVNELIGVISTEYQAALDDLVSNFNSKIEELATVVDAKIDVLQDAYDEFVFNTNLVVEAINNRVGSPEIVRVTLSADADFSFPIGTPTNHPLNVYCSQDATGYWDLTFPENVSGDITISKTPNTTTRIILYPVGAGNWRAITDDTVARNTSFGITEIAKGSELRVYGHSFAILPGAYVTPNTGEWSSQISRLTGIRRYSYANNGYRMVQVARRLIGGEGIAGAAWNRDYRGVVAIEGVINDILRDRTSVHETCFSHALRAVLATTESTRIIDAAPYACRVSGDWSTLTEQSAAHGNTLMFTTEVGAQLDFHGIRSPRPYVYILGTTNKDVAAGTLGFSVDGENTGVTYNSRAKMIEDIPGYGNTAIKIPFPNDGREHTVSVTYLGGSVGNAYVDALAVPGVNVPQVLLLKEPHVGSYTSINLQNFWAGNAPVYHGLLEAIATEFPHVTVVDLDPGWRPEVHASLDEDVSKFHPNELGMRHIADRVIPYMHAALGRSVGRAIVDTGPAASSTALWRPVALNSGYAAVASVAYYSDGGGGHTLCGSVRRDTGDFEAGVAYPVWGTPPHMRPTRAVNGLLRTNVSGVYAEVDMAVDGGFTVRPSAACSSINFGSLVWRSN